MTEMKNPEQQISAVLEPYPPEIQRLAQDLRVYLKEKTKPTYELAGKLAQSFNIGYGFTTTAWDCYCAIIVYRKHINLSLPSGAFLSDPEGLLHGTGSRVRHLKLNCLEDLKTDAVNRILSEAKKNALGPGGPRGEVPDRVTTVVKT